MESKNMTSFSGYEGVLTTQRHYDFKEYWFVAEGHNLVSVPPYAIMLKLT